VSVSSGLWALGLLVTLTVTVVGGLIVWNGQVTRLEERVEAMRAQVQALVTQVQRCSRNLAGGLLSHETASRAWALVWFLHARYALGQPKEVD
jgi:hypothetical protein